MSEVRVIPISHATFVLRWGSAALYFDPVAGAAALTREPKPDIVFVTDIHHDHCDAATLRGVLGSAQIVAPPAVKDQLPPDLAERVRAMRNGDVAEIGSFKIEAVPMYNLPEKPDAWHVKGRGNGYVVENGGTRVYVAGDTSATPEMRALRDIDIAFLPMNLPYTMSIEEAAEAALAFKPKTVYPYHYRGPGGLADVGTFKRLVNEKDPSIEVVLANWYGESA